MLDDFEYLHKLNLLLESGVYEPFSKYPTSAVERKVWKLLWKYSNTLSACLKYTLTPYHSKPAHLYGLPKIHKPDVRLRPIISSIESPCYALDSYLYETFYQLVGKTETWVKNWDNFCSCLNLYMFENQVYWSALVLLAFWLTFQWEKLWISSETNCWSMTYLLNFQFWRSMSLWICWRYV